MFYDSFQDIASIYLSITIISIPALRKKASITDAYTPNKQNKLLLLSV